MTRQAQVGLFTIVGIIGLLVMLYVISDIGQRASGYKMAIHFRSAAGLRPAALVNMAGVTVGSVDRIDLRKDYTTDVVVAIKRQIDVPVGSKFLINVPLTGEPTLQIVPPRVQPGEPPPATYPHDLAEQSGMEPQGTNPVTITDLLEQGQGEVVRLDTMLAEIERAEPKLITQLQDTIRNADVLTANANSSLTRLSSQASDLVSSMSTSLLAADTNVVDLTSTLNGTARSSTGRINSLFAKLDATASSLSASIDSLRQLAANPQIHENLIDTTRSVALTAKTFAELTGDLRRVTGDPQTQFQLRDTVAHIDAASQKANSLLAQLGGRSSVYGVDAGATPAPVGTLRPSGGSTSGVNEPGGTTALQSRLSSFVRNLAQVQVRVSQLTPERPGSANGGSPLLTADRGPQSDVNLLLFPAAQVNGFAGVNDLGGGRQTWNLAALSRSGNLRVGGGILYSRLGILGNYRVTKNVGVETRFYDIRHPTLDLYGSLFASQHFSVFGGERDTLHRDRRTVLGVQAQF